MRIWSRPAYLVVTAGVTVAGGAIAAGLDAGAPEAVASGLAAAWLLQAPSFWRLAGTLARGEPALRDWLGGIALRLGGLALIAAAGTSTELAGRDAAVAYVAALLAYLALEALWLLRRQPGADADGASEARNGVSEARNDERGTETPHPGSPIA